MKQRPRIYYSDTQKTLMWDRWQKGDSLHEIARLFDRGHSSVSRILADAGGTGDHLQRPGNVIIRSAHYIGKAEKNRA